jgi:hypothetical protein
LPSCRRAANPESKEHGESRGREEQCDGARLRDDEQVGTVADDLMGLGSRVDVAIPEKVVAGIIHNGV